MVGREQANELVEGAVESGVHVRPGGIALSVDGPTLLGWQVGALALDDGHEGLVVPQSQTGEGHLTRRSVKLDRGAPGFEVELERRVEGDLLKVPRRVKAAIRVPRGVVARVAPIPQVQLWQVMPHVHEQRRQPARYILERLHGHRGISVRLGGTHRGLLRPTPVVRVVHQHLGHVTQTHVLREFALSL